MGICRDFKISLNSFLSVHFHCDEKLRLLSFQFKKMDLLLRHLPSKLEETKPAINAYS